MMIAADGRAEGAHPQPAREAALEFLVDAGAALSASLDYESTLDAITRALVPRRADVCTVYLVDGDAPRLAAERHGDASLGARAPRGPALDHGRRERVRAVIDTGLASLSSGDAPPGATDEGGLAARASMVVPLALGGRRIGALSMDVVDEGRGYDDADLAVAMRFADLASRAIENARHYRDVVEAKRLRDEMVAVVSHDLRSPLSTIALNATLLGHPSTDLGRMVSRIHRATARASRLVDDLLVAARIDARQLELERADACLASMFEELLALHMATAESRAVRLEATVHPGVPRVFIDRHRMLQLLGNLVENALKFTPRGGWVTVTARADEARVTLVVDDTGVGVREHELPHLFDRFWQGAHSRRADAGLGLSIAKGVAEAHGGTIAARANERGGATFEVVIPRARRGSAAEG